MATKINIQIPTYGKEESKERKVKYEVVFSHIESAIKEILLSNDCGIPYHWLWFCVQGVEEGTVLKEDEASNLRQIFMEEDFNLLSFNIDSLGNYTDVTQVCEFISEIVTQSTNDLQLPLDLDPKPLEYILVVLEFQTEKPKVADDEDFFLL